jgi:hypothetical protein
MVLYASFTPTGTFGDQNTGGEKVFVGPAVHRKQFTLAAGDFGRSFGYYLEASCLECLLSTDLQLQDKDEDSPINHG